MNRAEVQKRAQEDVAAVQQFMAERNVRVEARQRINTSNGFIEHVVIYISELVADEEDTEPVKEQIAGEPQETPASDHEAAPEAVTE